MIHLPSFFFVIFRSLFGLGSGLFRPNVSFSLFGPVSFRRSFYRYRRRFFRRVSESRRRLNDVHDLTVCIVDIIYCIDFVIAVGALRWQSYFIARIAVENRITPWTNGTQRFRAYCFYIQTISLKQIIHLTRFCQQRRAFRFVF